MYKYVNFEEYKKYCEDALDFLEVMKQDIKYCDYQGVGESQLDRISVAYFQHYTNNFLDFDFTDFSMIKNKIKTNLQKAEDKMKEIPFLRKSVSRLKESDWKKLDYYFKAYIQSILDSKYYIDDMTKWTNIYFDYSNCGPDIDVVFNTDTIYIDMAKIELMEEKHNYMQFGLRFKPIYDAIVKFKAAEEVLMHFGGN